MRLSTKGEYASRAMLELSRRYQDGPIHSREISKAQVIPQRFLEQILLLLKRAGYLKSRKGRKGGYLLAKPPGEINVAEVIRVMDGPLAPIDCVSVMAHEPCPMEGTCGLRWLWKDDPGRGGRDPREDDLRRTRRQVRYAAARAKRDQP
ncbi:MAG: Rrf2 family transcriptional regulator [Candidatus Moduliflexus flocculans]|nr:Rrf2 family transcriptional regulator [Candidatus Moduliflexus flocculans]